MVHIERPNEANIGNDPYNFISQICKPQEDMLEKTLGSWLNRREVSYRQTNIQSKLFVPWMISEPGS